MARKKKERVDDDDFSELGSRWRIVSDYTTELENDAVGESIGEDKERFFEADLVITIDLADGRTLHKRFNLQFDSMNVIWRTNLA